MDFGADTDLDCIGGKGDKVFLWGVGLGRRVLVL